MALEKERSGEPKEEETLYDDSYSKHLQSLGVPKETLKERGYL